jgi:hypothetical protein
MDMTAEEQAAADKIVADKAKADADAKAKEGDAEYWKAEAKKAFDARDLSKADAKAYAETKAELDKLKQASMTDAEKTAARLKELEPIEGEHKAMKDSLQKFYDLEVADIPDNLKTLIPSGPLHEQLAWIKNAKAQGVFGKPAPSPGQTKPGQNGGNAIRRSEYNALSQTAFEEAAGRVRKGLLTIIDG